MPIGEVTPWEWRGKYVSNDTVLERMRERFGKLIEIEQLLQPAQRSDFSIPGAVGFVELVSPMSHRFCEGCNRLRLTANGFLNAVPFRQL